jgi:hypothetical protein
MIRNFVAGVAVVGLAAFGMPAQAEDVHVTVSDPNTHVTVHGEEPSAAGHPMFFAMGGGNSSASNLNEIGATTTNFDTGYNIGGGLGIQLSNAITLRASYTYTRATTDPNSLAFIANTDFDRHYYGGDLQFRATNSSGIMPYLFLGGGAVTVSPAGTPTLSNGGVIYATSSFTKPAAHGGLGLEYQIPHSGFGLFAQGDTWTYKFDHYGFDKTQWDINWGGGITYRFGY